MCTFGWFQTRTITIVIRAGRNEKTDGLKNAQKNEKEWKSRQTNQHMAINTQHTHLVAKKETKMKNVHPALEMNAYEL